MHDVADQDAAKGTQFARILWLALVANFSMFVIEGTAGVLANSSSLQADAVDFLADSLTYALTLYVAARSLLWRAWAGLAKGLLMAGFGFGVLAITGYRAFHPAIPEATTMGGGGRSLPWW